MVGRAALDEPAEREDAWEGPFRGEPAGSCTGGGEERLTGEAPSPASALGSGGIGGTEDSDDEVVITRALGMGLARTLVCGLGRGLGLGLSRGLSRREPSREALYDASREPACEPSAEPCKRRDSNMRGSSAALKHQGREGKGLDPAVLTWPDDEGREEGVPPGVLGG